ncbi:MAG: hypothetical protein KF868_16170 [Acidobacteria bacterium]|nr:hypothetical protein [Acidobacteriota bacterium]
MNEHFHTSENQAAGAGALPSVNEAFASTQAAGVFTEPECRAPVLGGAADGTGETQICLWPSLRAGQFTIGLIWFTPRTAARKIAKKIGTELGYKLATTLLVSDLNGYPIAPISLACGPTMVGTRLSTIMRIFRHWHW